MSEFVRLEKQERVAVMTVDRPKALNALDRSVIEGIDGALDRVESDREIGALVVTGAGRAFVAGADVAAMRTMTPLEAEAFSALAHRVFSRLEGLAIPTIAAVNGFALGGGCELALACDFIFASREAKIGQPETKLGLIPRPDDRSLASSAVREGVRASARARPDAALVRSPHLPLATNRRPSAEQWSSS